MKLTMMRIEKCGQVCNTHGNIVTYVNIVICVVVPTYIKLGLLGPSFAKIEDRIKNQDENSI